MNQFRMTIQRLSNDKNFDVNSFDVIEGKSLIEVLSKLLIVIVGMQRSIEKENGMVDDNDIPF